MRNALAGLMERADGWLAPRGRRVALAALLVAGFLVIGLVRVYPYVDDVLPPGAGGLWDDWASYKVNAISILEDGLHIEAVPGPYFIPGGFLYNYVVAGIYLVAGRNSAYVYVLQYGFLALSAVLMGMLARRWMSQSLATMSMFVTAAFLLLTFHWWVIRLLSENVTIVLYPIMLLLLDRAIREGSPGLFAAAGAAAGLTVLTRSNLLPLPVLLAPLAFWAAAPLRRRIASFALFGVAAAAVVMLLPLRNLYVAGEWVTRGYGRLIPKLPLDELLVLMGKRLLYCFGILIGGLEGKEPGVVIAKSWALVCAAALVSGAYLLLRRRFRTIDAACILTVAAAYGPFLVLPKLGGYGLRFQQPYGPLLLFLVFHAAYEVLRDVRVTAREPLVGYDPFHATS